MDSNDDVYIVVVNDMAADMAMTWEVGLTWQSTWQVTWRVTIAAHPMSRWAQFRVGHKIRPDFQPFY